MHLSTEIFIEKSKEIHGDTYDYSLVNCKRNHDKVKIICKKHGVFEQAPTVHLRGSGCQKCGIEIMVRKITNFITKEEIVRISSEKHNNKFGYSLLPEKEKFRFNERIMIICPNHGTFKQKLSNHLSGMGCKKCANESVGKGKRLTHNEFIENVKKIHGDKFDYSKTVYITMRSKVKIICKKHGEFEVTPQRHTGRKCGGCRQCFIEANKIGTERFIERARKVHGDLYDYSKVDYKEQRAPVVIICKKHGEFQQQPFFHIHAESDCQKCANEKRASIFQSSQERNIFSYLKTITNENILTNCYDIINGELDIFIPQLKYAFEYNGSYYHCELFKHKNYHLQKTEQCVSKNISLFHIYENDWLKNENVIKSMINKIFDFNQQKITIDQCTSKQIDNLEKENFLCKNHIKGNIDSDMNVGLLYNNEIVSIICFRKNKLVRYCNKLNYEIIGIEKILLNFFKEQRHQKIIAFADRSWGFIESNFYEKMGFSLIKRIKPYSIHKYKNSDIYNSGSLQYEFVFRH